MVFGCLNVSVSWRVEILLLRYPPHLARSYFMIWKLAKSSFSMSTWRQNGNNIQNGSAINRLPSLASFPLSLNWAIQPYWASAPFLVSLQACLRQRHEQQIDRHSKINTQICTHPLQRLWLIHPTCFCTNLKKRTQIVAGDSFNFMFEKKHRKLVRRKK